ncbi:hypothetical protein ACEWY4_011558 [Coilia grayii]|uniref:Fibronectin type-III domain-containing protein n=1 Tax=Coilia grayii TaxID=363190 RepID=A0ABD1JY16_9TELE
MRPIYHFNLVGNWTAWDTHQGVRAYEHEVLQMFPYEEVLQEGADVHFCCVAPKDSRITSIIFNQTQYPLINISSQVKAIAVVNLNTTGGLGVLSSCQDSKGNKNSTVNFVTFFPQRPKNLSCETEDLKVWTCTWRPGRPSNLHNEHNYNLLVQDTDYKLTECEASSCHFRPSLYLHEYNVTVMVTSSLGQIMESIKFPTMNRVFPVAKSVSVKPGVTEAGVSWTVEGNFSQIPVMCQVQTHPEANIMDIEQTEDSVLRFVCQLESLNPSTQYCVKVRCAVSGKTWGRWTDSHFFTTYPLVRVDVWRRIQSFPGDRSVLVVWRTYGSGNQSDVESYEVHLQREDGSSKRVVERWVNHTGFLISEGGCDISVRAILYAGSSIPSHVTIPPAGHTEVNIMPKKLVGSARSGFVLAWAEDASAVCGYAVEWCQNGTGTLPCNHGNLRWEKVHRRNTSLALRAGAFITGRRYTFSVFGCRQDGHHLIETHVGYLQEQRPTRVPEIQGSPVITPSSVKIEWSFPEDDPLHPGFITGYLVTVKDVRLSNQNQHSYNISVDDPHTRYITVPGLEDSRLYQLCVHACTSAGPGPRSCCSVETSPDYSLFMVKILIPVAFLFGCCILIWPYWKRLRDTVVEIFTHSANVNVKIVELDSCLYETSERIQALRVEECMCCDLEIVNAGPSTEERTFLICNNDSGGSLITPPPGYCCSELLDDVWDDPDSDRGMSVCNFTYSPTATEVSFCTALFGADAPTEEPASHPHTSACSLGYVTSAGVPA